MSAREDRVLVGDIGGTHVRFAIVDPADARPTIVHREDLQGDIGDFGAALRGYLERAGLGAQPQAVSISVAGPVHAGRVAMTNRDLVLSEQELRALGFRHALLINDFAALAFSVATLRADEVHAIGPALEGMAGEPISIIGAGTGFGAACLARFRGRDAPLATEGGHAGFAPADDAEIEVLKILRRRFGRADIERVLSGPGLENLHQALAQIAGRAAAALSAAQIVAAQASDPDCAAAVDMFCAIYGSVAGDFALLHGARGGVFIAGGIAQKIEATLVKSRFRARFEDKDRFAPYVAAIPTKLILSEDTAFLGAARASLAFRDAS